MQTTLGEITNTKLLKNSCVSVPNKLNTEKIFDRTLKLAPVSTSDSVIKEIWDKQHPLIHTWIVLSSVSICFLSALFFIFP